ncbi:MAG TPA: hypothetical protein VKA47_13395 [Solirubrobacterales bacterium]|nr:hypothetical protein [Solirubrobacterales bacterium]
MLTLKRFGVTTVLVASIAMPATAAAQGQDLRSPDRQFPSAPRQTQDLRNADRRSPAPASASAQDLRNADRRSPVTVDPAPAEASVITAIEVPGDGFDWADAGIGAAGGMAILAILAGMAMAVTHRRQGPRLTA